MLILARKHTKTSPIDLDRFRSDLVDPKILKNSSARKIRRTEGLLFGVDAGVVFVLGPRVSCPPSPGCLGLFPKQASSLEGFLPS